MRHQNMCVRVRSYQLLLMIRCSAVKKRRPSCGKIQASCLVPRYLQGEDWEKRVVRWIGRWGVYRPFVVMGHHVICPIHTPELSVTMKRKRPLKPLAVLLDTPSRVVRIFIKPFVLAERRHLSNFVMLCTYLPSTTTFLSASCGR